MKKYAFLLLLVLVLCSCARRQAIMLPTSTPELLIAPRPTERISLEEQAEIQRNALFATAQAEADMKTATAEASGIHVPQNINQPTATCIKIKGNINSRGERIYHCPSRRDYDKITMKSGDKWFCTESEAKSAGFREPEYPHGPCH
jgi:hypothetical protein